MKRGEEDTDSQYESIEGGGHLQERREPTCQYLDLRLLASRPGEN